MQIKSAISNARSVLGAAAIAGTLFGGNVLAASQEFPVDIHVSTKGIDLSQSAGATLLYRRLQYAAWAVCSTRVRAVLQPVADAKGCAETSLAAAIRAVGQPRLTQIYLETHTSAEAAAQGIGLLARVAAK